MKVWERPYWQRRGVPRAKPRKSVAGEPGKEEGKMAGRGRPPKPTALKILEGNRGKRALNTDEPKPKSGAPKCPSFLSPEAKKEWRRIVRALEVVELTGSWTATLPDWSYAVPDVVPWVAFTATVATVP